jgi:hypothetical protein
MRLARKCQRFFISASVQVRCPRGAPPAPRASVELIPCLLAGSPEPPRGSLFPPPAVASRQGRVKAARPGAVAARGP